VPGAPDIIVAWLQNDYGQLGRPAEAIAHALVDEQIARRVAYVEPFVAAPGEPQVDRAVIRGLDVYRGRGTPPATQELAQAVIGASQLEDPILLNFGVAESNWWFHYEFAPRAARTVLVTHDKIALWEALAPRRALLERTRECLIAASEVVCGLSEGSIDDVPGGVYVGHGCDAVWNSPGVDDAAEPEDLAAIPHPRAIYVGALSMRFDAAAVRALARSGVQVVLVGLAPGAEVLEAARDEPGVHFLGPRAPEQTPAYLLRCDVGIIPHTDEPFTRSMEPHKAYNYACAGLRTVTLNTVTARSLGDWIVATDAEPAFVEAVRAAVADGRLAPGDVAAARAITWGSVARRILAAADQAAAAA
jgi:Glycosyl transferases group 1